MTAPSGKTFVFPASLNDSPLFNRENLRFSILSVPVINPYYSGQTKMRSHNMNFKKDLKYKRKRKGVSGFVYMI